MYYHVKSSIESSYIEYCSWRRWEGWECNLRGEAGRREITISEEEKDCRKKGGLTNKVLYIQYWDLQW